MNCELVLISLATLGYHKHKRISTEFKLVLAFYSYKQVMCNSIYHLLGLQQISRLKKYHMLTELGKKLFFFMLVPEKISRYPPAYQDSALAAPRWVERVTAAFCQKHITFNRLVGVKKLIPTFYFPGEIHSGEFSSSYFLTTSTLLLKSSSLSPSAQTIEHYFLPQAQSLSFILPFCVFFVLTDSSEQMLNVTVLYVKATHTHLPCCLFLAERKPDGFSVRKNLHFNQASGQSNLCQSD